MQLIVKTGMQVAIELSERNITELYENMHDPRFNGLRKLQVDDKNPALDHMIVSVLVAR